MTTPIDTASLDQSAENLIERARSTTSAQVRSDLLENFFDLILNQEPSLLVEQFPSLLSFWDVSNDTTKLWLLECMENACVSNSEIISVSIPILSQGVENTNAETQQRAIRAITVLLPHILYLLYVISLKDALRLVVSFTYFVSEFIHERSEFTTYRRTLTSVTEYIVI
jgi:hypothetical protein